MKNQDKDPVDELQELIESFRAGRNSKLREIYRSHKKEFLLWAKQRTTLQEEVILDVFQEAVIILYKNVVSGALTELRSSLKTYLFGIAKKRLYKAYHKESRFVLKEEISEEVIRESFRNEIYEGIENNHLVHVLGEALKKLGDTCRKLLQLAFYDNYSLEAIATRMDYKNSQVVSSKLYKCIQRLKKLVGNNI